MNNEFWAARQNSLGRLAELQNSESPAPQRNKKGVLAGDSIFGQSANH